MLLKLNEISVYLDILNKLVAPATMILSLWCKSINLGLKIKGLQSHLYIEAFEIRKKQISHDKQFRARTFIA